jgi:hypothetical protein
VNHLGADMAGSAPAAPGLGDRVEIMVTADPARFTASAARLFDAPLPEPRLVRPFAPVIRVAARS